MIERLDLAVGLELVEELVGAGHRDGNIGEAERVREIHWPIRCTRDEKKTMDWKKDCGMVCVVLPRAARVSPLVSRASPLAILCRTSSLAIRSCVVTVAVEPHAWSVRSSSILLYPPLRSADRAANQRIATATTPRPRRAPRGILEHDLTS